MRIAAFFIPFYAVAAGAIGFYFRLLELWNVFDPRTGLPERGATITYALIALSVVFILILVGLSIGISVKRTAPEGFENSFGTGSLSYPFTFVIIGLIWLLATVIQFLSLGAAGILIMSDIYFLALSALSAISIIVFSIEAYQNPRSKSIFVLSIIPTLFMCFWLILLYRQNASNPILLSYVYQCLAIMASILSFYLMSGFVCAKPALGKTIFFQLAAIFFCFVTLADAHHITVRVIFASVLAINIVNSYKLIRNLEQR